MTAAKLLSAIVGTGILLFNLIAFGFTWEVLGIGIVIGTICSIIYYKTLKRIDKLDL